MCGSGPALPDTTQTKESQRGNLKVFIELSNLLKFICYIFIGGKRPCNKICQKVISMISYKIHSLLINM